MTPRPLTPQRQAILDALRDFIRTHGYSPSVRQLTGALGRVSYTGVHKNLVILRNAGLVSWTDGEPRTLVPRNPDASKEAGS